jgi:hypothetical protein
MDGKGKAMTKYAPIHRWLRSLRMDKVAITFEEIEGILGFQLPQSARVYRAWWENECVHHRHTYCRAWLDAGFETQNVNLAQQTLVFQRYRG